MHLSLYAIKESVAIETTDEKSFQKLLKSKYRHAMANNTEISLFQENIPTAK